MALEIERKFLVDQTKWPRERMIFLADRVFDMKQAYLPSGKGVTVRVRTREILRDQAGTHPKHEAFLTIKGPSKGISRPEYEYPIPYEDAVEMMQLSDKPTISKLRHELRVGNHTWEVDSFTEGGNKGLILAEIELSDEDEEFQKPEWLGEEVSHDSRYSNSKLAVNPWNEWKDK